MSEKMSQSRIRVALAQFCITNSIDVEELYAAMGANITQIDAETMAHMAGVFDGMSAAVSGIREHGIEKWAKDH